MDDLDQMIAEEMKDPEFAREWERIKYGEGFLHDTRCAFDNCVIWYDSRTLEEHSSHGPVDCPCQE